MSINIRDYDVVIVGGGPSGSTAGSFLKKYRPDLRVAIIERENFPREHVGESQLPPLCYVLDEMGVWDKVEAANFPIKIGATYRWGSSRELWDFEFMPPELFRDEERPATFEGQRKGLAFQVDRAIYDKILLDHAESLGCEVFQNSRVTQVPNAEDRIEKVVLDNGDEFTGRYYIDSTGHSGLLRRALGVEVDNSTSLQNIAFWDYWTDAEWAVTIGVGGTRIQIMSVEYGWLWFIPITPTRTSIGLVMPADYYKKSGKTPKELYEAAVKSDDMIATLTKNATSDGDVKSTKDWSFIAKRMVGENWFLAGESAGFADPILSAGLTIAQAAAREAAYTIIALEEGKQDAKWLKDEFELNQSSQVKTHIRFADYWYSANSQFEDLKEYTSQIAAENGLELTPEKAWAWIAQGGFIGVDSAIGTGGFDLRSLRDMSEFFGEAPAKSILERNNVFKLDFEGSNWKHGAVYVNGKVEKMSRCERDGKVLPLRGAIPLLLGVLQEETRLPSIVSKIGAIQKQMANNPQFVQTVLPFIAETFEAMIEDGWVKASYDPSLPLIPVAPTYNQIKRNTDQTQY